MCIPYVLSARQHGPYDIQDSPSQQLLNNIFDSVTLNMNHIVMCDLASIFIVIDDQSYHPSQPCHYKWKSKNM